MTPHRHRSATRMIAPIGVALLALTADAADDGARRPLREFHAELTTEGPAPGLPPFDPGTGRFDESPPPGFTAEEWQAAVRGAVVDEVDRYPPGWIKDLPQVDLRWQRYAMDLDLRRDAVARKSAADLWYSRTPESEIPPPATVPEHFFRVRGQRRDAPSTRQHVVVLAYVVGASIATAAARRRLARS